MDIEGPKPTGKAAEFIAVEGRLMPWLKSGKPVLLEMPGSDLLYLPVFDTEEDLVSLLTRIGVEFDSIKQVVHAQEMVSSLPSSVVAITDIRFLENGRIRFKQLALDKEADDGSERGEGR